jgi:RNA polymerase sigma factor (sigma-70 family)
MTDSEGLLARAVAGEESAWRDLVARYQALVHSVIRAHRIPTADGEDLFQETFLRLHRHAHRIEDPRALTRWLMVTARNLCLDHLARRWREALEADPPDIPDPRPSLDVALERLERAQEVREALGSLSERCQALLKALYYEREEPDYRRVADQLGMPVGSVGPTRGRCLERLLEALDSRRRQGRSA